MNLQTHGWGSSSRSAPLQEQHAPSRALSLKVRAPGLFVPDPPTLEGTLLLLCLLSINLWLIIKLASPQLPQPTEDCFRLSRFIRSYSR